MRALAVVGLGALFAGPLAASLAGCSEEAERPVPLAEGVYGPLGAVRPDATAAQRASFARGQAVANRHFSPEDGLGPHFNTTFCGSCHNRPVLGGSAGRYRNFLLTRQVLPDGSAVPTGVNGVHPFLQLDDPARTPLGPGTNAFATRNPIPFFGVGLLAELPAESILENADPDDTDGDGISGRPNYDRGFVGRFGRKAQTVSIEGFIRGPLFNHLGITSEPLSLERKDLLPVPSGLSAATRVQGLARTRAQGQAAAPDEPTIDDDGVQDPELAEQDLFDLIAFSMLLAAPAPSPPTEASEAGRSLFREVGCEGCHVESLVGPRGRIPLYSDLLLHDMGEALADGVEMGLARGAEFRTQPLWGVVATGPWLHDGRADTLHDAIALHGGEAAGARDRYLALTEEEQTLVLAFLGSLGGRDQATPGLVPPDEPSPRVGELGGPVAPLGPEEAARFEQGRLLFDRNVFVAEGLGPRINGDACRACHFEPAVGGAGPRGLNVVRQGVWTEGGVREPAMGSLAHRLLVDGNGRAPVAPEADVFETRQAPSLFGLGLLERVPEAEVLARADPEDADRDGIRGRVQRLPDGRLGRFGWKADIPSLAEFVRDALSVELGLTLPDQPGLTFGRATDEDAVADPEVDAATLDDLSFWLEQLAPPPAGPRDAEARRGEAVFAEVGCDGCHVPALAGPSGPVRAYTDLLLHDVMPEGYRGVSVHAAGERAFRTAPLWGIAGTGPYMHDGRATTLEAAIAAHYGEAAPAAAAAAALSAADRRALIAFLRSL